MIDIKNCTHLMYVIWRKVCVCVCVFVPSFTELFRILALVLS